MDDTLDSGETLARAVARLRGSGPAWLRTCVLLDKPSQRTAAFSVDYVGFTVPDL
ncbi:phosphoribosyltransferase family protein [Nitrospira sp. Kam-Ns4a]